jgi:hypothetical protein
MGAREDDLTAGGCGDANELNVTNGERAAGWPPM